MTTPSWGDRILAKRNKNKSKLISPQEYFASQYIDNADHVSNQQKITEGLAQSKTYYMNGPNDDHMKPYLHELGRYQRKQLDGMYNAHEDLQEGTTNLMAKRVRYGMS